MIQKCYFAKYKRLDNNEVPGVSETLRSSSLVHLILSKGEIQMSNWKHNATKIMQEFQDDNNEGIDFSKCLFNIVLKSKCNFHDLQNNFLMWT